MTGVQTCALPISGIDLFEKQDNFGNNVHVQFINNTSIFPMPESQLIYAGTYLKYEEINGKDRILIYSTQCIENGTYTSIFLNDTDGRTFTWWTDDYIPPESFNQMCFEYTVCHELGHVLGLAHCSYEYPESMMHSSPPFDAFVAPFPKEKDIDGLNILLTPVGIEDYIWINLTVTD